MFGGFEEFSEDDVLFFAEWDLKRTRLPCTCCAGRYPTAAASMMRTRSSRSSAESTTPQGGASHDDGRQDELAGQTYADLTPFPCCWCPPADTNLRSCRPAARAAREGHQPRE